MKDLEIYCVTNKRLEFLENFNYKLSWVGLGKCPEGYIQSSNKKNIHKKEKFYSELTFHYWYWKNLLDLKINNWVGFCQKRRFWIKKNSNQSLSEIKEHLITESNSEWSNYDVILCEPIKVNNVKKIKMIKRGFRSIIKDPRIFFDKNKQSLKFHFDMHHGYGNIEKAITKLDQKERDDFLKFLNENTSFNPHIMCITKPKILNKWFQELFGWLEKCETIFEFDDLKGYDTQRLFAYLAERYMSFWFNKYYKVLNWPWTFYEESKN